jgi:pimeloyl-ACP methyl ester carboxylesterase
MTIAPPTTNAPGEVARLLRGVATLPAFAADARRLRPSRGVPVLVVPGFMTGDGSTWVMRQALRRLGHRVHGWAQGRNRGDVEKLLPGVVARLEAVAAAEREPVHLLGWSLGGVLVREAARARPDLVAQIITMGTPVVGGPKYTMVAHRYRERGVDLDRIEARVARRNAQVLPVPVLALYSRADAVVAWQACLDPNPDNQVEHVEVRAGHAEMGFSREVLRLVAARLAG